jgi:hypothetical protein
MSAEPEKRKHNKDVDGELYPEVKSITTNFKLDKQAADKADEDFKKRITELSEKYTEVDPSLLVSPTTDPVFVKKTWADKKNPDTEGFETNLRKLLQSMNLKNLENIVIVDAQCHGGMEVYQEIKKEQYNNKSITTMSGKTFGEPSYAHTPDSCFGCYVAPLGGLNYISGNYENSGVGFFLNPANLGIITEAIRTGNLHKLFKYTYNREPITKYNSYEVGLPGCCPNYLLDFVPGVNSWAAFVATSQANKRNLKSLMKVKADARSRRILVSSSTEKMEAPFLNDTYQLFGDTQDALDAEKRFKDQIKKNNGKMYVREFFEIIKDGFPGKTIICFFDICSAFFPNIVGRVENATTKNVTVVNLPIDQKLNKDNFNIDNLSTQDPNYIIFQEYLKACAKFKPIRFTTTYDLITLGKMNKPTYDIEYSPILKEMLEKEKKKFDLLKQFYVNCCVSDPSFTMGEMRELEVKIDTELVFAAKPTDEGGHSSNSQAQDVTYLYGLTPIVHVAPVVVCKPRGVISNVLEFISNLLFKKQPGCNNIFKYTLKPGEADPIMDDIDPFPVKNGGGSDSIQSSLINDSSSSAAGGGGGDMGIGVGSVTNQSVSVPPIFSGKAGGGSVVSMDEETKGGSRRRPKNKPKNRKTKKNKNKKQRKTKNRKNRHPKRNKTRRY